MKKSAVIIPVWKKEISYFEKISLQQCCLIFKNYIFCIVTHRNVLLKEYIAILEKENILFQIHYFNRKSFVTISSYNRLMLSLLFYLRFVKYKYILIYQLDCFVFRDELNFWIDMEYSYIGAPWLEGYSLAKDGSPIIGVGNGGFSLRKVRDHLRALLTFGYIQPPEFYFKNKLLFMKNLTIQNNVFCLLNNYMKNEDIFWSKIAATKFPWFKIPDWKTSALFSVEVQPKYFFELNNQKIPFGCHAWWRYDLDFWRPYIEKFGYNLSSKEKNILF